MKILVVEDHQSLRTMLAAGLAAFGHEVTVAADGEEGIEIVKNLSGELDAVVTDRQMPKRDGFEVARFVKAHFPAVKVVMMTADLGDEVERRAFAAGVDAALQKPFASLERFENFLRALVEAR
ncbi:MAG: response regulator [Patescibacteria group bacterium]